MHISLNRAWKLARVGEDWQKDIDVPYDSMLLDEVSTESKGGPNICWLDCHDYVFTKNVKVERDWLGKDLIIEFEGVYHNAEVFLNGQPVGSRPYGFTNFYVNITEVASYGEENELKVIAHNADQPNSRFYSGSGIYRPVHLYILNKNRVKLNGIKILPLDHEKKLVRATILTTGSGKGEISFIDEEGKLLLKDAFETEGTFTKEYELKDAKLWSPEDPNLIKVEVSYENETYLDSFGLRTISWNTKEGFMINGKKTLLLGACLHADNGMIGAASYRAAEYRKVKLMKDAGYNSIRSAHNPMSKSMLEACDKLGILVMDEYVDMWFMHKLKYDYAGYCTDWYKQDLTDMADKDYNHPSVVMISLGNEVGESSNERGIEFCRKMAEFIKPIGAGWATTCGINVFFNALASMGMGVYSDDKAEKKQAVGSEFFNNLQGLLGDRFMKWGATWPIVDRKTKGVFSTLDIAGYNYGIRRYKHDTKKYKDRMIVGSETFCKDAAEFMRLAKQYPNIIGDYVWAGQDYLGEIAIGSWEYKEYADDFNKVPGWMSAGSGRVDLAGDFLGEAGYTRVAFEKDVISMAVCPVHHTGEKHSPSAWKMSNAIPNWSYEGLNGKPADVEVYTLAPQIELVLNGKVVAKKKSAKNGMTKFRINYEDGELLARALDDNGKELGAYSLKTAGKENALTLRLEEVHPEFNDLRYVHLTLGDKDGNKKPMLREKIEVKVEGGNLIALGHACPFNKDGYKNDWTSTYYGAALAVIEPDGSGNKMRISAHCALGDAELQFD
ncbi:MAG: DUF4982 domain-containing protein [Bacilli bacterium]|nr:DUF4982 domain-containing protein [Bacilli bacterium]